MVSKIKNHPENKAHVTWVTLGAWIMTFATIASSLQIARSSRQPVALNTVRPAYALANPTDDIFNRNDNENETVHLPTKFDAGQHVTAIAGRK